MTAQTRRLKGLQQLTDSCRLMLFWMYRTRSALWGKTEKCRHDGHLCNSCASLVSKCGIELYRPLCFVYCPHDIYQSHCQEQVNFDFVCRFLETNTVCCSCRCTTALSTLDSTRVSVTSLLYMPPSAEKTQRPRDKESAKVWATQGCHNSLWSMMLNLTRTAWLGNMYVYFTSSFIWNRMTQMFPC